MTDCNGCKYREVRLVAIFNGTPGSVDWCKLFHAYVYNRCGYYKLPWYKRLLQWKKNK